jgi:hypothetical protein
VRSDQQWAAVEPVPMPVDLGQYCWKMASRHCRLDFSYVASTLSPLMMAMNCHSAWWPSPSGMVPIARAMLSSRVQERPTWAYLPRTA